MSRDRSEPTILIRTGVVNDGVLDHLFSAATVYDNEPDRSFVVTKCGLTLRKGTTLRGWLLPDDPWNPCASCWPGQSDG